MAIIGVYDQQFKKDICHAVGVDPGMTRRIILDLPVDSVATVRIHQYLSKEQVDAVAGVVKRYDFVIQEAKQK